MGKTNKPKKDDITMNKLETIKNLIEKNKKDNLTSAIILIHNGKIEISQIYGPPQLKENIFPLELHILIKKILKK